MAEGGVGGGEFAEFCCVAGKRGEAGFFKVGDGGEECGGKAGSVFDRGEVAVAIFRNLPAEKFEGERRGRLRLEIGNFRESLETNVGERGKAALKMQAE